jgi:hypothetical protein
MDQRRRERRDETGTTHLLGVDVDLVEVDLGELLRELLEDGADDLAARR